MTIKVFTSFGTSYIFKIDKAGNKEEIYWTKSAAKLAKKIAALEAAGKKVER